MRCLAAVLLLALATDASAQRPLHHYTFFGMDRERLHADTAFLASSLFEGAQVSYSWQQLEPGEDAYDFALIRDDLALLSRHGKRLFIQFQDVTFSPKHIPVPRYLRRDPRYHGGAAPQSETGADTAGWATRRWDPAVQARMHRLLETLGREFDGRIEGINFAESSVGFGEDPARFPEGFSPARYRDAIIENMRALKRAFPKSVTLQYGNFMPGEWRPTEDRGYLVAVYRAARELGVGVGGPDLLPHRPGQAKGALPLIRELSGIVPTGLAVQDGNLAEVNRQTGQRVTVAELVTYARDQLMLDYLFWGTEEPYYTREVLPYLRERAR